MSTTPTPSEPRDEHVPTFVVARVAAAGPPASTEPHGAPLIADEHSAAAAPEQPAPEPTASSAPEPTASSEPEPAGAPEPLEPAEDSRWAPPPARPEPETASAAPAADAAPDLVEPDPAPVAPSATATAPAPSVHDDTTASAAAHADTASHESEHDAVHHDAAQHDAEQDQTPHDTGAPASSAPAPDPVVPVTAATAATSTPAAPAPAPQVVYVPAPTPPRKKGNRGMGVGIALAATPVFAAAYAGLALLFVAIANGGIAASGAVDFFTAPVFWLPIIAFALFYVLLALIVNRAGWWAHVLGGFVVALLVYGSFLVATLLTAEPFGVPNEVVQQFVAQQLTNPIGWAAAIAAREVPVWVGGLVAKRGRSVKSRNVESRAAYERELAESRASRPAAA